MLVLSAAAQALEFREEPYRVGIVDVGQPILLDYPELTNEMNLNSELRDWIAAFGRPEYAEYQKIALSDPFYPYEIRLYYIEGRSYVAFGRVNVSPAVYDYGVRKYIGKLDSALLQRLLTARPLDKSPAITAAREAEYGSPFYGTTSVHRAAAPEPVVEEVVVEEVVEIISPETVIIESADTTTVEVAADAPVQIEVEVAPDAAVAVPAGD
jgi:hypothetical protein